MTLKEQSSFAKAGFGLLDALLVTGAFHLAFYLTHSLRFDLPMSDIGPYLWLLLVFIPVIVFLLNHYGLLVVQAFESVKTIALRTGKVFVIGGVLVSAVLFVAKAEHYSRLLVAYGWAMGLFLVLLEKLLVRHLTLKGLVSFGQVRLAVIVGRGSRFERVRDLLKRDRRYSLAADGVFDASVPFDEFKSYLVARPVDEVFFVLPRNGPEPGARADEFLRLCESLGVPARVLVNLEEVFGHFSCSFVRLAEMPMLVFHPLHIDPDRAVVKRLMDLAGALVGLVLTGLLCPLIALAVKLDSRGPVFFSQERVGQNGRRFRMYKFRTMRALAQDEQQSLAEYNEMRGPIFKVANDPRITRVGRLLRRLSLDELPQFWNVLKGEMSLVGTRPPTPQEVEQYELWHYRRISIRPGMTGLYQVSGRGRIRDFDEIVRLDLKYVDEWSLALDVKILLRTLLSFARGQ